MRKVPFPGDYRRLLEKSRVIRRDARERPRPPFFSVITVTMNRAGVLERAMRSLQSQEERDFEHIVVDGGSSDATVALLQKAGTRVDLWLSERDSGIADALNKGVSLASGEWVVLLHSDDQFVPGALRHWRRMAQADASADILSCAIRFIDEKDRPAWEVPPNPDLIGRGMSMPHPGMAVKRNLYERIGLFRTDYRVAMDYEFTLRALKLGARLRCDPAIVTLMQTGGISGREFFLSRNENLRARIQWLGLRTWVIAHYTGEVTRFVLGPLLGRLAGLRRFFKK